MIIDHSVVKCCVILHFPFLHISLFQYFLFQFTKWRGKQLHSWAHWQNAGRKKKNHFHLPPQLPCVLLVGTYESEPENLWFYMPVRAVHPLLCIISIRNGGRQMLSSLLLLLRGVLMRVEEGVKPVLEWLYRQPAPPVASIIGQLWISGSDARYLFRCS